MSPQSSERPRCPICLAEVSPGEGVCGACGSTLSEGPAQAIRGLNYLLSELSRWEDEGIVAHEQARELRESYEGRREELRARLIINRNGARPISRQPEAPSLRPGRRAPQLPPPREPKLRKPRLARLETLADPHTIRVLLYTGAAMLVVGVVIWLRDILYLKLREPIVQAALLAVGTAAATASGWLTILRTRLLLTGRALTLTGSLLVPVNFWFLARSGLIEQSGSAWLVCALCALLYALTAAILREKLYVYLASVAAIATSWAIIYRVEREAYGLYTLALMSASLIFLHLSRLFPVGDGDGESPTGDERRGKDNSQPVTRSTQTPFSRELWGLPLVQVALAGVALAALLYLPLRLGSSPSFADGLFRLRATEYDASMAILLFVAAAYATWFAGRHVFTKRRAGFYALGALALLWAEFLALDGFGLSGPTQLSLLAATALVAVLTARVLKPDAYALALHRAGLVLIAALALVTYPVVSVAPTTPLTHSLILILLASTYAVSGSSRFGEMSEGEARTHATVAFAFAALVVMQAITHLRVGDTLLLTPSAALGTFGLLSLVASLRLKHQERVRCFRAGLFALVHAFTLALLRAGFEPLGDLEVYTSPVSILLLAVAYGSARRGWDEYAHDASLLLWAGSILLAGPLLIHALQYRLFLDVSAPGRDLMALCASLALVIFGVTGRRRAPVVIGAASLVLELSALALTSVDWLQIPLKAYLISTGVLILLIWGLLEFRREHLLLMRRRFNERRETARERFGEWK